jgi:hypothetical protein
VVEKAVQSNHLTSMTAEPRGHRWVFTINNPTGEDEAAVNNLLGPEGQAVLGTCGREVGAEGTPHLQGFVKFTKAIRRRKVQELLGGRAYLDVAKGSDQECIAYCEKEQNLLVEKNIKRQRIQPRGDNNDKWLTVINDAKTMTIDQFVEAHPDQWVLRRSAIEKIMLDAMAQRAATWGGSLHEKNVWIWGAPGIGKSRWALQQVPPVKTFKKNFNKWWDGFQPMTTNCVIIEDYPPLPAGNVLSHLLKIWGDRYPFVAEVKNSGVICEPGRWFLIITSNYPIERCIQNEEDVEAIKRRFHEIEMTTANMVAQLRLSDEILVD